MLEKCCIATCLRGAKWCNILWNSKVRKWSKPGVVACFSKQFLLQVIEIRCCAAWVAKMLILWGSKGRRTPHEVHRRSKVHVVGIEIHYPGRLKRASFGRKKERNLADSRSREREREREKAAGALSGCFEQLIQPLWRNNRLAKCSPAAACCYTPSAEANSLRRRPQTTKVSERKTDETMNKQTAERNWMWNLRTGKERRERVKFSARLTLVIE